MFELVRHLAEPTNCRWSLRFEGFKLIVCLMNPEGLVAQRHVLGRCLLNLRRRCAESRSLLKEPVFDLWDLGRQRNFFGVGLH